MLIAVGSTNPVKTGAAASVVRHYFPDAVVRGISVPSGVPDQPWGDAETIQGARSRAVRARNALQADWGIGIEGGVVDQGAGRIRLCAWAVVVDSSDREGVGGSLSMELPERIAALVRGGMELGSAMDMTTGEHNVKQGAGAVGILTRGLVSRRQAYEVIIAYACVPLLEPIQSTT